jgi:hypothetical protein
VYEVLKPLQGTVIPYLYGEGLYDGSPALGLLFIPGKSVHELLREGRFSENKDLEHGNAARTGFVQSEESRPGP